MLLHLMNKYIRIDKEITDKNSVGTPLETYVFLKNCWASIQFTAGRTIADQYGENINIDAIFSIRYDEEINTKCKIIYNNQTYKILYVEEIERKGGLRLKTICFKNE